MLRQQPYNDKTMKYLVLIFLIIPSFLYTQGWERIYGGEYHDKGYSVQQTTDGGYIILGSTKSFGNGSSDMFLIKTDSVGDTTWTRTFGGNGLEVGYSVQQTTDEGYILSGETSSFGNGGSDVYLIKTDSNGDTTWTKAIGGNSSEVGFSVQQTTDGGYIISGETWSFGNGHDDVYLIRTSSTGDTIWTKTYGGPSTEVGNSVQQTTDGGFIITGTTDSLGNGDFDIYLIKTDDSGNKLWSQTFGGSQPDHGNSVQQTNDGGYIITGTTDSFEKGSYELYLIKTNSNGDTTWTKTFGGMGTDVGNSIQQTNDNGYIIAGYTFSFGYGFSNIYLIKTDNQGNLIWTKTFGGSQPDFGNSVQQTTDGGYIIVGESTSFGGGFYDVYIIKTDKNGIVTFTTEIPNPNPNKRVIKIVDFSGREIPNPKTNHPYIEIYDDGTTQKKMKIK